MLNSLQGGSVCISKETTDNVNIGRRWGITLKVTDTNAVLFILDLKKTVNGRQYKGQDGRDDALTRRPDDVNGGPKVQRFIKLDTAAPCSSIVNIRI